MAYTLTRNTSSNANVIVAYEKANFGTNGIAIGLDIAVDYTERLDQIIVHLSNISSTLADISYRHRLLQTNVALLAFRGSRQDYGIVTRMSNTDCWLDMCPYDASFVLMGLNDGNLMAYYNEILIENNLTPIIGRKVFENAGFVNGLPDGKRLPSGNVFIDREEIPPPLDLFNLPSPFPAKPNPEID